MNDEDFQTDDIAQRGAGGQQVGLTRSVIKVTHIPTGLYAVCGSERSQHKNRTIARAMVEYGLAELGFRSWRLIAKDGSEILRMLENAQDSGVLLKVREAYEVYAGMEGFISETAPEAYVQQEIKRMADILSRILRGTGY